MANTNRLSKPSSGQKTSASNDWWRSFLALAARLQISYLVVRFCHFLARVLPVRVSYGITIGLAYLTYVAWPGMRRTATANVRRVLGSQASDKEVRRVVRAAYRNYFKYLAEFLMLPSLSPLRLQNLIEDHGWENVDRALAHGKGAIFVCFHLGNWDMAGSMIAVKGYPMNVVVDSFEPKALNDLIQSYRVEKGVKIIPVEQAARKVLQTLRSNEILGLLIDLPTRENGVPVQLFGATSYVPGGAATLSIRTGAKVLPGFLIRKPDNTFYGQIDPALEFEPTGNLESDVQALTQQIVDHLSGFVRQHPEQWFLARDLWFTESPVSETIAAAG